jgi:predicted nuclease with TOPRIM domain
MEYLPLILEGIEFKIKKLIFRNQQLSEEKLKLNQIIQNLENQVADLKEKISGLEDEVIKLKITKVLSGEDTLQARHQINELLREIEKCYSLLNR